MCIENNLTSRRLAQCNMETIKTIIRESVPTLTDERLDECISSLKVFCQKILFCELGNVILEYNAIHEGFEISVDGVDTDYTLFASNEYVEID